MEVRSLGGNCFEVNPEASGEDDARVMIQRKRRKGADRKVEMRIIGANMSRGDGLTDARV